MSLPAVQAESRGFRAPGTTFMVTGGLLGAFGAYLFQVYGGRELGTEAFAPVSVLWTLFFILGTVLLIPVEQYVTREVASGRKVIPHDLSPVIAMAAISSVLGAGFVLVTLDRFFEGSIQYAYQIVLLMVGYSLLFVGKGVLAGRRRFADVGWLLIVETVVRLAAGVAAIRLAANAESLGWAMVLGGFAVLGLRWWRFDSGDDRPPAAAAPRFLGEYVGGAASSQILLGAAPIAVGILGADPEVVSIVFVTFTLYRAPMTLILNLQGRILPYLFGLSSSGNLGQLARISRSVVFGGTLLALLGAAVGWLVGPDVVRLLFGQEFAPSSTVAMFAAGGVMAAAAAQIAGQILVAEARTRRLAMAWSGGLLAAVVALLVLGGEPDVRVAASFAVGEGTALLLMAVLSARG
jgi:O-antigen/teichoic acid export membrane protein